MAAVAPTNSRYSVQNLPPNVFSMVLATGIVSIALSGAGYEFLAGALFWLGAGLYGILWVLLVRRFLRYRKYLAADLISHARAPGFFTLVAAPCILGNQCLLLFEASSIALSFWFVGLTFWLLLNYLMLPRLMQGVEKPRAEEGLSGAWLLTVVATQSVSILACQLAPTLSESWRHPVLFVSLAFWLLGSMLYIWLIALIFHRILFLPLPPGELTPPYWINMGAMAISSLAGVRLVGAADRMPLLTELLPFLRGMTLLFWATGTWWIPVLLALWIWRHRHVTFQYEHGNWSAVFPLGVYTVCSQNLVRVFQLPFAQFIPQAFLWIAVSAWSLTFLGLVLHLMRQRSRAL